MLEVTANDKAGAAIFKARRIYMTQCTDSLDPIMVLGPTRKLGIIRDTTFQPFKPKREEFEIKLTGKTEALHLQVKLIYQFRPGDQMTIAAWQKIVSLEGLRPTE